MSFPNDAGDDVEAMIQNATKAASSEDYGQTGMDADMENLVLRPVASRDERKAAFYRLMSWSFNKGYEGAREDFKEFLRDPKTTLGMLNAAVESMRRPS